MQIEEKTINAQVSYAPAAAVADIAARTAQTLEQHSDFFANADHQQRVQAVRNIVENFFTVKKAVYVTPRSNRGQPFTAVKVESPKFPVVSSQRKLEIYIQPLQALGVEIVFSKNTNSYLYRVK